MRSTLLKRFAMAEIKVNCIRENCPVPLVETRKAIRKAAAGDIIEVTGTHPTSKREIPMAVKEMGLELLGVSEDSEGVWTIRIKV
jgi:tRNA 2-thiouridine synthesizing protein A